jgi:hypothetical protein
MEPFIIYLAKASGLIAVFFLAYTALLKKETFFTQNRFFLLAGLFTSVLLPFAVYTKVIWVAPQPATMQQINLDDLMVMPTVAPETFTINWFYVALAAYCAGLVFFLAHFIKDFYKVTRMLSKESAYVKDGFKYIDSDVVHSPFSFFRYIVYNSNVLQPEELNDIIAHEKVHSSQRHSLDIIISQLFCIAFWFNPIVWLYKKAISQNLEFIADAEATKCIADKKAYQKTLLKITVQPECIAITNHFYQSLIKKRIVMLNKQQSKRRNFYKYGLIAPVLVAFIVLFQVEVLAQEKEPSPSSAKTTSATTKYTDVSIVMDITKDTKDESFKKETAVFKKEFDADVTFTNVKRNAQGEITAITVTIKDKDHQESYPVYEVTSNDDKPIQSFTINVRKDGVSGKNLIDFHTAQSKVNIVANTSSTASSNAVYPKDNADDYTEEVQKMHDVLYIIDDIPQDKNSDYFKNLDPNNINSIDVLKNGDELVKLYGIRAKNGVIRITTKKRGVLAFKKPYGTINSKWDESKAEPMTMTISEKVDKMNNSSVKQITTTNVQIYNASATYSVGTEDNLKNILESNTVDYKKAYIRINGKEATATELENTKPNKIQSSIVIPGGAKLSAKYGEKALNGAIIVELKSFKSEMKSVAMPKLKPGLEAELEANTGYIIHKRTDKKAIKFYTKELAKKGLEIKIKTLERNKEGVITSIEIELVDTRTGKVQAGGNANSSGIHDMYVGLKNGEPALYTR